MFFTSYSQNPSYGNAAEVEEDLLKQKNELRVKEWLCSVAKEQVGFTRGKNRSAAIIIQILLLICGKEI